jgi:hypothetical protein
MLEDPSGDALASNDVSSDDGFEPSSFESDVDGAETTADESGSFA